MSSALIFSIEVFSCLAAFSIKVEKYWLISSWVKPTKVPYWEEELMSVKLFKPEKILVFECLVTPVINMNLIFFRFAFIERKKLEIKDRNLS